MTAAAAGPGGEAQAGVVYVEPKVVVEVLSGEVQKSARYGRAWRCGLPGLSGYAMTSRRGRRIRSIRCGGCMRISSGIRGDGVGRSTQALLKGQT